MSISGTAEAGSTVAITLSDAGSVHTVTSSTTATGGSWTFNSLNAGALNDGTITVKATATDAAGNVSSPGAQTTIPKDTVAPTVTSVTSTLANGSYGVGTVVPVTVSFSESVTVTGSPKLTLNSGGSATYTSGSGSSTLAFSYTVAAGENSADLDYTSTGALVLNGGTIADATSNAATLTLAAPGAASSLAANKNIVVDTTAPTVTSVSSTKADGSYGAGTLIPVTVTFSENVTVTGTPQLTLATGSPATTAVNYTSGSGTNTLTFNYTVAAGNTSADLDYAATTSLALAGGSIKDAAANNATLTLATPGSAGSLGANKNIVIDTTPSKVTSVSSTVADGTYGVGSVIPVTVTFTKSVTVTGTPTLTLSTGSPATTAVSYTSGSGTTILTFNYTVASGNTSADLNYSSTTALALNGGTIKEASGTNAILTLPGLTAAGSLATNKNIIINTTPQTSERARSRHRERLRAVLLDNITNATT